MRADVQSFDVVIVGGGLVGASLALALGSSSHRVALLETTPPPSAAPRWDERCIALNAGSRAIFAALGVWSALAPAAEPIRWTHISERGRFGVARFTAEEAGLDALGYNIPIRHLGAVLWTHAQQKQTRVLCPAQLTGLERTPQGVRLSLQDGSALNARLVIAADGAQSSVRELLSVGQETRDYGQYAIVTAVKPQRPHGGCAYERFTPEGPIAVLPKPDGACSLVWTVPRERVPTMLAWDDAEFLKAAQEAFGERLGRFHTLGCRSAYPLFRVMSERLTLPRVLFAGNAAQSLHPVAAQGFNLGLRDVAAVAAVLRDAEDPGAPAVLQAYERERARDRTQVANFTDRLIQVFSNRLPGLATLRHLGLLALDLAPPVKQAVLWQNLGYGSGMPEQQLEP